ncbi:hypothetical protein prwr041_19010 [Prevotella herbatica]|uniref:Uncharacterized protein n=2 Tax=Prevotella herbatica TaxID=2801997 RepID=A0ABN6ENB1_9BACT|nr:hypothetical protein prwr041_19010 [Prevotella herbatica]
MLAQEPNFIREVNVLYHGSIKPLNKEYITTSSKADAGLVLFVLSAVNTEIIVLSEIEINYYR